MLYLYISNAEMNSVMFGVLRNFQVVFQVVFSNFQEVLKYVDML